ncbi:hypothetical protein KY359_03375 [Candidatus Woesearchaeota archaeon]|nr:hypothetical protein [Candidatus Woesearchaeota archaeon]
MNSKGDEFRMYAERGGLVDKLLEQPPVTTGPYATMDKWERRLVMSEQRRYRRAAEEEDPELSDEL